jgi:hypothetical protein
MLPGPDWRAQAGETLLDLMASQYRARVALDGEVILTPPCIFH